jgi:hypothetical protein
MMDTNPYETRIRVKYLYQAHINLIVHSSIVAHDLNISRFAYNNDNSSNTFLNILSV